MVAVMLGGCGGAATTASSETPVADLAAGEAAYQANCAQCHGSDLRGTDRGPSHLSIVYEPSHHSDAAFQLAVRNGARAHHWGFGDMPPVEGLTDAEIADITAFVRSVQEREGFEPYPP
jgi:mono/diheme cytochrome c family protein